MNRTIYSPLIFELSKPGRKGYSLPHNPSPKHQLSALPENLMRRTPPTKLPEADELTVVRHYTNMSGNNFGVDTGFYPLGSCTMKYNPKINEELAALPGFTQVHPAQDASLCQGALKLYDEVQKTLSEIAGLSRFTLNPYAGAHAPAHAGVQRVHSRGGKRHGDPAAVPAGHPRAEAVHQRHGQ